MPHENTPYRSPNRKHERRFFYKYMSAETAKIVLESRALRWSSPQIFNEPFDVAIDMPLSFGEEEFMRALGEEVAGLIERGEVPTDAHPAVPLLIDIVQRLPEEAKGKVIEELRRSPLNFLTQRQFESAAMVRQMWSETVEQMRVLCLSEANDVTSMWYHYSDKYKGVVLRLDVLDEIDSPLLLARPVMYSDDVPPLGDARAWARATVLKPDVHFLQLFKDYQYTKKLAWGYEREWRIVTMAESHDVGKPSDYPLRPESFSGVYFGVGCSPQDRDDILSLLGGDLSHVQAWEAKSDVPRGRFMFEPL